MCSAFQRGVPVKYDRDAGRRRGSATWLTRCGGIDNFADQYSLAIWIDVVWSPARELSSHPRLQHKTRSAGRNGVSVHLDVDSHDLAPANRVKELVPVGRPSRVAATRLRGDSPWAGQCRIRPN